MKTVSVQLSDQFLSSFVFPTIFVSFCSVPVRPFLVPDHILIRSPTNASGTDQALDQVVYGSGNGWGDYTNAGFLMLLPCKLYKKSVKLHKHFCFKFISHVLNK